MTNKIPSKLEKASWIVSIASLIIAILTWLFPKPLSFANFISTEMTGEDESIAAIRLLLFLVLIAISITFFAFNAAVKGEALRFLIEFRGDWCINLIVIHGLFILLFTMRHATPNNKGNSPSYFIFCILLISALAMIFFSLSKGNRGVKIKGQIEGKSVRGWPLIAAFLVIAGFLSMLIFGFLLIRSLVST